MNPEKVPAKNRLPVLAVITVLTGIALCLSYILRWQGVTLEEGNVARALGEGLGGTGFSLLVLVYARTAFKLLVRQDSFWKRLEPFDIDYRAIKTLSGKILFYLNKTHPYVGAAAIVVVYSHCYVISRFHDLLPLRLVLALLAWQGIWGLVLKTGKAPAFLKRRGHLFHSQLVTGALILAFAALGHYLLGG